MVGLSLPGFKIGMMVEVFQMTGSWQSAAEPLNMVPEHPAYSWWNCQVHRFKLDAIIFLHEGEEEQQQQGCAILWCFCPQCLRWQMLSLCRVSGVEECADQVGVLGGKSWVGVYITL